MDETTAPTGDNQQVQVPDVGAATETAQGNSEPSTWRDNLPEPLKASKTLEKFKSEQDLAKSYIELETRFRSGAIPVPEKDAPPEEWDKFYAKTGRPKQAGDYVIEPKGYEIDAKAMGELKASFHKAGLDQRQAGEVFNYFNRIAVGEAKKAQEMAKASNQALERAWGQDKDQKLELARRFVVKNGGEKALAHLESTGASNDAVVLQLLAAAAEGTAPHRFVDGVSSKGTKPDPYSYMNERQA
jgi:hypothetical protein